MADKVTKMEDISFLTLIGREGLSSTRTIVWINERLDTMLVNKNPLREEPCSNEATPIRVDMFKYRGGGSGGGEKLLHFETSERVLKGYGFVPFIELDRISGRLMSSIKDNGKNMILLNPVSSGRNSDSLEVSRLIAAGKLLSHMVKLDYFYCDAHEIVKTDMITLLTGGAKPVQIPYEEYNKLRDEYLRMAQSSVNKKKMELSKIGDSISRL